ncbi:MAG: hypothetical protein HQL54_03290 [Magnetococcales bacterium]|nr:hypothetical protein [Magnetococcales bacterium]
MKMFENSMDNSEYESCDQLTEKEYQQKQYAEFKMYAKGTHCDDDDREGTNPLRSTSSQKVFTRDDWEKLDVHPAADKYPMQSERRLLSLAADMAKHGQREPCVLISESNPVLLAGRNRVEVSKKNGMVPLFVYLSGMLGREPTEKDILQFVIGSNELHRHMSTSQKAMVAVSMATLSKGQSNASKEALTQDEAANLHSISRTSVQRAAKFQRDALPEIQAWVTQEGVTLSFGNKMAKLSKDHQKQLIQTVHDRVKDAALDELEGDDDREQSFRKIVKQTYGELNKSISAPPPEPLPHSESCLNKHVSGIDWQSITASRDLLEGLFDLDAMLASVPTEVNEEPIPDVEREKAQRRIQQLYYVQLYVISPDLADVWSDDHSKNLDDPPINQLPKDLRNLVDQFDVVRQAPIFQS